MARDFCDNENSACKYFNKPSGCFSDLHHTQFPASEYRTKVEKAFRELPENKVQLCRNEHDELHATEEAPLKPDRETMITAIASELIRQVEYGQSEVHGR